MGDGDPVELRKRWVTAPEVRGGPLGPTQRSRWAAPFIARARVCMIVRCGEGSLKYN